MPHSRSPLARAFARFGRGYRRWRAEQLMPSILFDLNRSLGEDTALVPDGDSAPYRGGRRRMP